MTKALPIYILLAVIATGCVTRPRDKTRVSVPFLPQAERYHCGVTCLAMALDYFAVPYDLAILNANAYVPALSGTPPELLADVAESAGLKAGIRLLNVANIQTELQSGRLPILFIPPAEGETIGHFILVTEATGAPRRIRAHDGMFPNRRVHLNRDTYLTILLSGD